jgi:hypothetical protein
MLQLFGRRQGDPIQGTLARAVRQIVRGVIAGQRHDPAGPERRVVLLGVRLDQQPDRPRIDCEVSVEALDGRVEDAAVDALPIPARRPTPVTIATGRFDSLIPAAG